MKSEKQFIDEMWDKVSKSEYDENQAKAAKMRHKKIIAGNLAAFFSVLAAFALLMAAKSAVGANIYVASTASLAAGYWLDKFVSGGGKQHDS